MVRWVVAIALVVACGGDSSQVVLDGAAPDAAPVSTFPGCAPTSGLACADHLCWVNPTPLVDTITLMSGSGCDVWLGGSRGLYRRNGDAITGTGPSGFYQALAVMPGSVWASSDVTRRFDGHTWTVVDSQPTFAIWGSADDDVWVATFFGLQHWDGHTLASNQPGVFFPDSQALLWGTSRTDVRASAGDGLLWHWNGTTWTVEDTPGGAVPQGLWGRNADDWYAVANVSSHADVWHRTQHGGWQVVHSTSNVFLQKIWGIGGEVWVAPAVVFEVDPYVLHFDGTSWTEVPLPSECPAVRSIGGSAPDDVLFGCDDVLAHWDGTRITPLRKTLALQPNETTWVGAWGTAADDVWLLAERGTTAHWDGAAWRYATVAAAPVDARAISGTARDDAWIAGATTTATVWHWDGAAWSATDLGAPGVVVAIYAAGPRDVWAAGDGGAIWHFDGAWHRTPVPTSEPLRGVWGHAGDAWAVGGQATSVVLHWDGQQWTEVAPNAFAPFTSVWGRASNDVYFGSVFGLVYRFDGTSFLVVGSAPAGVTAIGGDASRLWYLGDGFIMYDHGTGLEAMSTPPNTTWLAGYFPSRDDGWIAGTNGAILRYRP